MRDIYNWQRTSRPMAKEILPEARWALALGKLSQTLLPVSPALPCCHYIWLPYWADFFLRIWCYFYKMCFITNFKFEIWRRKKHRGATCFCQQLGSIYQVWTTSTSVRGFGQLLVVPRWSVHTPESPHWSLNSVMEWQTRQSNYRMIKNL